MKILKLTIFTYKDLIRFYKRIFSIFYWQCFLPTSVDSKISKLSCALNRHILLYSLVNLIFYACCLHIYNCPTFRYLKRSEILSMFSTMYAFPIWIVISSIFLSLDNFKKIWFDLTYLNDLILKRLNHKNNYHKFRRSIIIKIIVCLLLLILCGILILYADNERLPFCGRILSLKLVRIYIELHAIFVIDLHHHMYKMFCKYINFAYHLHRSHLVFSHIKSIDMHMKYYKEIHYKFWQISCELSNIFGITIMTFCLQTSIDVINPMYHVFIFWDVYYKHEYMKLISNVS